MTGFVIRAKERGGESIVWRPEVCGENATPPRSEPLIPLMRLSNARNCTELHGTRSEFTGPYAVWHPGETPPFRFFSYPSVGFRRNGAAMWRGEFEVF